MASLPEVTPERRLWRRYFALKHTVKKLQKKSLELWDNELISISIIKKILFIQGYLPTLETHIMPGNLIRYLNPRILIVWGFYLAFISSPLAAFMPAGQELIDTLEPIAMIFLALMVAFYSGSFLFLGDRFKDLSTALEETLNRGRLHEEHPKVILKQTKILSLLTVVYFGECMFNTVVFVFGMIPQLIEKRVFYTSAASPFFEVTLVGWVVSLLLGSSIIALGNSFFMANLVQAIGQFRLLNHNLNAMHMPKKEQMDDRSETINVSTLHTNEEKQLETVSEAAVNTQRLPDLKVRSKAGRHQDYRQLVRDKVIKRRLRSKAAKKKFGEFFQSTDVKMKIMIDRCVRHHQAILSYVGCINAAFNLILIQQYSGCVMSSLMSIILVNYSPEITLKIVLIAVVGAVCNITLGIYCFLACKLTEESELIRDSIFGSDWLAASDNFKRSMRLMICRSNQPSVVRVGGFITVSRESYWSVLKLIYTYYMAARAALKRIDH